MRRLAIRWKLTLWYGAVLAVVLVAFGCAVYVMMRHALLARLDSGLEQEITELEEETEETSQQSRLQHRLEQRFAQHEGYEFQVDRMHGGQVFRSRRLRSQNIPIPLIPHSLTRLDFESAPLGVRTVQLASLGRWRVATRLVPGSDGPLVVQAAGALAPIERELSELLAVLLLSGPLALGCALGGGYLLARQALAPVDRMTATAEDITATRLDRRIEILYSDDELGRLAQTLNRMIARLERSFEEIRRFTADAAHELRTPLAVMRNEAEVILRSPRDPADYRRVLEDQLEEIERLSRLADRLLFLCRCDAGLRPGAQTPVRIDDAARAVAEHMRAVAEGKRITLEVRRADRCSVRGDEDQLRRLLFNLVDNAIKFTPNGGAVTVECRRDDGRADVIVADTGVGIPAEHLPHVFERFYRVEPARDGESGGAGLGLAISRTIAEAHGAELRIESAVGEGTRVILNLPVIEENGSGKQPA
jgi:heavy metal sensor kinase